MYPKNDDDFEETTVSKVDAHSFNRADGWTFGRHGADMKVGDVVRFYPAGISGVVRGFFVNGKRIFYRTVAEDRAKFESEQRQIKKEKKADFEAKRSNYDMRYADLPEVFQRRLDRFREHNKDFRWDLEPYELFVCEEAVKIAKHLKTEAAIVAWKDLSWEKQKKQVPIDDGHSGNTFGCACLLARLYVTKPDLVAQAHGALTPLVGCKEYGCDHGA